MKNLLKKLTLALAFALSITLCLPAFTALSVYAYTPSAQGASVKVNTITVPKFVSTATVGQTYTIIQGTSTTGPVTHKVIAPNGKEVALVNVDGKDTFKVESEGNYKIVYTCNDCSTEFRVAVSGINKGYTVSFPTNSAKIVPTIINPSKVNNALRTIEFPDAIVTDAKGEVATIGHIQTKMSKNDSTATEAAWDKDTKTLTLDSTKSKVVYTITYEYVIGEGDDAKVVAQNHYKITADKDYDNEYKFTYNYDKTIDTTAEIGVETILPGIEATNMETEEAIATYYTISVKANGENVSADDLKINKDGKYVLTPKVAGNYVITYTVKDAFNNASNIGTNNTSSYTFTDVKDTKAPTSVFATTPYTLAEKLKLDNPVNAYDAMKTISAKNDFYLLPIYAEDNSNGIQANNLTMYRTLVTGSTTVFDEKLIVDSDNKRIDVTNKVLVFNASDSVKNAQDTDVVFSIYVDGENIEILKSQIYIVDAESPALYQPIVEADYDASYYAKDKNSGKSEIATVFAMKIDNGYEATAPVVTMPLNLPSVTLQGKEIVFTEIAPTNTNGDTRLSNFFTYTTDTNATPMSVKSENSLLSYDKETKEYKLTIPDDADFSTITLKVSARNDADANVVSDTTKIFGEKTKTITILKNGDTATTTVTNKPQNTITYVAGQQIALPEVVYSDDLIEYINVKVQVKDSNGNKVTVYNANNGEITFDSATENAGTYKVVGAYFIPEQKGQYTVTYSSIDAGNNITIVIYNITVEDDATTWDYDIELPATINNGTAERREQVRLVAPEFVTTSDSLEMKSYYVNITGGEFEREGINSFTPLEKGTYKVTYTAKIYATETFEGVNEANEPRTYNAGDLFRTLTSEVFTIDVTDTVKPVLANENDIQRFFFDLNASGSLAKDAGEIDLPEPQVSDTTEDIDFEKSTVVISHPSSSDVTIKLTELDKLKGKTFTSDATYTITYKLVDFAGNIYEKAFTLDVGDVEAPVITVEDNIVKSSYKVGDVIAIDMAKIQATDNVSGNGANFIKKVGDKYTMEFGKKITLKLQSTSSNAIISTKTATTDLTDIRPEFDLANATAGTYKLIIEITDGQDKVGTYDKISFSITDDENTGATSEEVLGVVLIIVSILLLGGVVTYFIVSKKSFEKKYK